MQQNMFKKREETDAVGSLASQCLDYITQYLTFSIRQRLSGSVLVLHHEGWRPEQWCSFYHRNDVSFTGTGVLYLKECCRISEEIWHQSAAFSVSKASKYGRLDVSISISFS